MAEKLIVGPIDRGTRTDREPFNIDDDSFPALINAYQWRGRIKRKRGTSTLGRLTRQFNSMKTYITLDGGGNENILTGFSVTAPGGISPGSVTLIVLNMGTFTYMDTGGQGNLYIGSSNLGTINYVTGDVSIPSQAGQVLYAIYNFYPALPVMGIEDLNLQNLDNPGTLAFDTTYAYNVVPTAPYDVYDVSFYKNPPASGSLPFYVQKEIDTALTWNGQTYQQFWSTNYQGAFWATNGITVNFDPKNIGMQFLTITAITIHESGTGNVANPGILIITFASSSTLMEGDFVFINEVKGIKGVNFQTGYITSELGGNQWGVTFPNATFSGVYSGGGIAQVLTNTVVPGKDCLRWYDGDPTLNTGLGWVNFMPPLSQGVYSIGDLPQAIYYLITARMIVPFKDRLLFFGPVLQSSSTGPFYLEDTVVYSQNGTPYYTASYTNDPNPAIDNPTSPTNVFFPMLIPAQQTATSPAYFEDQTGFGGFLTAGVQQPITTVSVNEDALIVGFYNNLQTRFIYSGSDVSPFNFFIVNSELGSSSTFSAITMDQGVITRGPRGFIMTSQTTCNRIDLSIPDQVFQIQNIDNGPERFCAQRDFINEWIYFTYPSPDSGAVFPTQTLQFNYRDNSWAIFNEAYTTYGSFRFVSGYTWATIGMTYPTWEVWNVPWSAGASTLLQPQVVGGTAQGFLMLRDVGTGEGNSLFIQNIVDNVVTSPDHCLVTGTYIIINNCLGTVSQFVNGKVFTVLIIDKDTFSLNPSVASGTYTGAGTIQIIYNPIVQTKQFPTAWGMGRKTRIGTQMYLLSTTPSSQITLQIFLSQNSASPYNDGPIYPSPDSTNNTLIYSNVLYTCPESTNLGLTPAQSNLQMPTAVQQQQIWHRINTSLIGDTVQLGFTMSPAQLSFLTPVGAVLNITGASQATQCVVMCTGNYSLNQLVTISGIITGMTQLNGTWIVVTSDATTVTLNVDSTGFTAYTIGGSIVPVSPLNQFAEIELHGFVLDISPSQLLC